MTDQPNSFSFADAELDILKFWQEHGIFQQTLAKTKDQPAYTFYDGPPFATGLPHHGHLLASTIKDIIPRYFTMCGYYVERRFGWDCHGLPVEYEIDKKFGKPTDEIIKEQGVKAYNDACRSIVQRYTEQWQQTITRLGRWVDFDNDYKTMDHSYMESVWWVFQQLWNKNLIYQGTKVVPFSTALGTGLSNFEAGSNYQDVQDPAVTVLVPCEDDESYLAIWTTTPWTLPSNLGICVNASLDYVKVTCEALNKSFYCAADCLESLSKVHALEIVDTLKGRDLVGKAYQPLFPYFAALKIDGAFKVHADDYVTAEDGTGLVHMAPAFGEDDSRVMQQAGVQASVCPVDDHGVFTNEVTDYAGQYVKDADKAIIRDLKERQLLFQHASILHSYPFCPRSDTPLIYRSVPQWYVKVESLKVRLLANNAKTQWVPDHIRDGRFGNWLDGARDWAISRERVWGTPLPLWINNSTGNIICIGSIAELERYTNSTVTDLHRDSIDHLHFRIDGEDGEYQRIPEVLDCWFESGSMPYAQAHYPFNDPKRDPSTFTADFIAEGLDQTRGWFYTLMVLGTALFDQPAFKNVIVNGIVAASDGKKMSKRLKNYTAPDSLMQQYGADALRLYLINSGLVKAEEQRFVDDGVKDMVRRTLLPWHNAFKFFHTYASVDQWRQGECTGSEHILDQWILSRLQSIKNQVQEHLSQYRLYKVVPELLRFIDDLTNTYIRLNRARFWASGMNDDKQAAFSTLFTVLTELTTCMAPFTPFLAEGIYQQLREFFSSTAAEQSVHLCDYPQVQATQIQPELERAVERLQHILILGRQKRNDLKIKIKTPLLSLTVIHKDRELLAEIKKLEAIIKQELNVKGIDYREDEDHFISLYAKPNSPVLGKRLQKSFGPMKKAIEALGSDDIAHFEQHGTITLLDEALATEDLLIFRQAKADTDVVTNRYISIVLDSTLTPELIDEGLAREVVNRIQKTRKTLNFKVDDRIHIQFEADPHLLEVINKHQSYICQETLGLSLKSDTLAHIDCDTEVDRYALRLQLQRV